MVVGEEVEEEGEAPIEDAVEYNHRVQVELASMPGYIADALLTADNALQWRSQHLHHDLLFLQVRSSKFENAALLNNFFAGT